MLLLADSGRWYSSGVFWGVAGIGAAAIFGALGIWAAFRAANPRQELAWQVRASVPLLSSAASLAGNFVEIRVDGQVLHHARVIELYLVNQGHRDIPTEAFDQHRPLRIDVGTPIVKLLNRMDAPNGLRPPILAVAGSAVALGPDLLKRGQAVTVSLLVDGAAPTITIPEPPFIDITIRELPDNNSEPQSMASQIVAEMGLMLTGAFWGVFLLGAAAEGVAALEIVATAAAAAGVVVVKVALRRRRSR